MVDLSDKEYVNKLDRKEKDRRIQELNDIRTVLSNRSGRRFMWRLLSSAKIFSTVFHENSHKMSYYSGQQDFGHFIMAEIVAADENLLTLLMKDNIKSEEAK